MKPKNSIHRLLIRLTNFSRENNEEVNIEKGEYQEEDAVVKPEVSEQETEEAQHVQIVNEAEEE